MVKLQEDFLQKYKSLKSPMTDLGNFVFYRTYSRLIPEVNRREYWWETVKRVVEYNCNLVEGTTQEEAELLYDNIFNLKQFPSGRSLWVGGTESAKKFPISNFNCSSLVVDSMEDIAEVFYLMMLGTGVGFRILPTDVEKIPNISNEKEIVHLPYEEEVSKKEFTEVEVDGVTKTIIVGDSKEGWVKSLYEFLISFIDDKCSKIVIDYNNVRRKGEPLRTFGGFASGHESLKIMFTKIYNIISKKWNSKLDTLDVLDICNLVGENVAVGGTRRCLPKDTLIHTENGLIKIQDVQVGDKVYTSDGLDEVTENIYQGIQKLITIKTQLGDFYCTPNHKMAVMDSFNTYTWKDAQDLVSNDRLVFVRNDMKGQESKMPSFFYEKPKHSTTCKDITIPKLDEDIAYMIGYLHGDGYVHLTSRSGRVSFAINKKHTNILEKLKNIVVRFGVNPYIEEPKELNGCYKLNVKSKQLATYFYANFKQPNTSINIPDCILTSNKCIKIAYLAGIIDSDGSFRNRPINIVTTVYEDFATQIRALLASIGLPTYIKFIKVNNEKWQDKYAVCIKGKNIVAEFNSIFSQQCLKYQQAHKNPFSVNGYGFPLEFNNGEIPKSSYCSNSKQITMDLVERNIGQLKLIPIKVISVENESIVSETYDLSIKNRHEFVCDCGLLVHNSAGICLFDVKDEKIRNAKNTIFTQMPDGTWKTDENLLHRTKSNNSIVFYEKPSKEELTKIFESIKVSGEPGFVNAEAAKKRFKDFAGVNPCFTGDTKLLTSEGYISLENLEGRNFSIINKDGKETEGKVWCSGEKTVYAVKRANTDDIKCTGNHVFMLNDGTECEALNLTGKRLMPFLNKPQLSDDLMKLGFIQGDGALTRLKSDTHKGLEVNIGRKDNDILSLFRLERKGNERTFYINGFNDVLRDMGFSAEVLPNRIFPTTYSQWSEYAKRSFLCGCYSANGSVLSCGRITYKTTCKKFAEQLLEALKEFNIYGYITTNKAKRVKFENGEYLCKESYDVNINNYASRLNFYNKINFVQQHKTEILKSSLMIQSPKVTSVKKIGDNIKVYDFTEPETHWGVIEGYIAHNCVEILLPDKGLCNLVTLNMCAFVDNGNLDKDKLFECARLNTRVSYRMACVELELPHWNKNQQDNMLLGCSFTGWQDAMNSLGYSIEQQKELARELREVCHDEMRYYAKQLGRNESANVTCLKPEGTLSLLPTVSPGLHYSHAPYYIRRVRVNADDPMVKVCEDLGWNVSNEVGQTDENCTTKVVDFPCKAPEGKTKYDIPAVEQLEVYKMFMENYVDQNASNTITVRENEWGDVCNWVYENWDNFVGVSFLSLDDTYYPLAPYEKITKEQYDELMEGRKEFDPILLNFYIQDESDDSEVIGECATGACPIR